VELYRTRDGSHSDADLAASLEPLGLEGACLLVYSRLISFGRFFREEAVIRTLDVLQEAVGPAGTVCVVCYTFSGYHNEVFDPAATKSVVGALGEVARKEPGFVRTVHPIYSNVCRGKAAAELARRQRPDTCFGPGSFFDEFGKVPKAKVLLLGTNLSATTIYHTYDQQFQAPGRFLKQFQARIREKGVERELQFDAFVKDYDFYAGERLNCLGRLDAALTELGTLRRSKFAGDEISVLDEADFRAGHHAGLTTDQLYFLCATKAEWEGYYLKNHTRLFHGQLDPTKLEAFRKVAALPC